MGILNIDDDLDGSVDDSNTAPDFVTPPNGVYTLRVKSITTGERKVKDEETGEEVTKGYVRAMISVVSTDELADGEIPVPDGSVFSQQWQWTKEGKEYFKLFATKILGAEAIKGAKWSQVMEALCDEKVAFKGRVSTKTSTVKGKEYTSTNINGIVPAQV